MYGLNSTCCEKYSPLFSAILFTVRKKLIAQYCESVGAAVSRNVLWYVTSLAANSRSYRMLISSIKMQKDTG